MVECRLLVLLVLEKRVISKEEGEGPGAKTEEGRRGQLELEPSEGRGVDQPWEARKGQRWLEQEVVTIWRVPRM